MKMAGIIIGVIILLSVAMVVIKSRKGSSNKQLRNYCINLLMPLPEDKDFNPQDLINSFRQMWGMDIVCSRTNEEGSKNGTAEKYIVGNGMDKNNLYIIWTREPLKREVVELLATASEAGFTNGKPISKSDAANFKNHKAYFQIEYLLGPADPKERVLFTAKLLLTLNTLYAACGLANASAQSYIPSATTGDNVFSKTDLATTDLFLLFVNIQMVSDDRQTELHTHGMDQFGLPDIQMRFSDKDDLDYHYNVFRNAAVYMIDYGKAMNIGDTAELAGDGKMLKIVEVKEEKEHPFGFHGVIGLTKQ